MNDNDASSDDSDSCRMKLKIRDFIKNDENRHLSRTFS